MQRAEKLFKVAVFVLAALPAFSAETENKGLFLFSPLAGRLASQVTFTVPNASAQQLNDTGGLYGMSLLYAEKNFTLGSSADYSRLDKSYENNYLFFTRFYTGKAGELQPSAGLSVENIHIYTQMAAADAAPLSSLDVDSSIWAFHLTAGLSYKEGAFRISPFAGYFNEQVGTVVSSPGMIVSGVNKYGFKGVYSDSLNYATAGTRLEASISHFLRVDSTVYFRFGDIGPALITSRNRIDFLLSREFGLSCKIDYFQDKYETNSFVSFGPVFVF